MPRVLLVDDDASALPLRRLILEREGHRVATAANVEEARAQFAALKPEVVVLDLRLPEAKDGLELIREFRSAGDGVRIVVLAGWPLDLENAPEAAMVDAVLAKPARTAELLKVVTGRR
jgi:DNA-binding response OmpR family regulator